MTLSHIGHKYDELTTILGPILFHRPWVLGYLNQSFSKAQASEFIRNF